MPCTCLSRKKKQRSSSVLPLQTDLPFPADPIGSAPEPNSPFLKLGRLTLLARIERAFNPSQGDEKVKQLISHIPASDSVRFTISHTGAPALELDLPPPLRPESILGCPPDPIMTDGIHSAETQEISQQEPPGILEAMPQHPNAAGLIRQRSGPIPKKLVLDMPLERRSLSLITPPSDRKSQYAVVLDTCPPLVQPPISPEPTPTFDQSNSPFQQVFHHSNHSMSPTHSTRFSTANSIPQYATVLRPCLGDLLTPPATPPPNIPLPPIPAASPSTTWPNRTCSLSMISRSPSAHGIMRDASYPRDYHPDVLKTVPPINRPRSKSSPLRSEVKQTYTHVPLPVARQLRFFSPSPSLTSHSEITDDTNPTSEEGGEPNSIPIALFESTYSPPLPPPIIQNFVQQQFLSSAQSSAQKLRHQDNLKSMT